MALSLLSAIGVPQPEAQTELTTGETPSTESGGGAETASFAALLIGAPAQQAVLPTGKTPTQISPVGGAEQPTVGAETASRVMGPFQSLMSEGSVDLATSHVAAPAAMQSEQPGTPPPVGGTEVLGDKPEGGPVVAAKVTPAVAGKADVQTGQPAVGDITSVPQKAAGPSNVAEASVVRPANTAAPVQVVAGAAIAQQTKLTSGSASGGGTGAPSLVDAVPAEVTPIAPTARAVAGTGITPLEGAPTVSLRSEHRVVAQPASVAKPAAQQGLVTQGFDPSTATQIAPEAATRDTPIRLAQTLLAGVEGPADAPLQSAALQLHSGTTQPAEILLREASPSVAMEQSTATEEGLPTRTQSETITTLRKSFGQLVRQADLSAGTTRVVLSSGSFGAVDVEILSSNDSISRVVVRPENGALFTNLSEARDQLVRALGLDDSSQLDLRDPGQGGEQSAPNSQGWQGHDHTAGDADVLETAQINSQPAAPLRRGAAGLDLTT